LSNANLQRIKMKVHFIAIGGSAMHNLALALHLKAYQVTGSDDEIFEPARTRLHNYGLLPAAEGWFPEKITPDLDAVILGMHAKADNPEMKAAIELGIRIFSYPEFLFEQSKDKIRVVIGGSHGKTTITAMILHVLKHAGIETDYMVGAKLEGMDIMVRLSDTARFMVFEGDEYLTSALDRRPKFHLYKPDIALISGIAWDHMNVFPAFDMYVDQFRIFINQISPAGTLVYCREDEEVRELSENTNPGIRKIPYGIPLYRTESDTTILCAPGRDVPLKVFGKHNLMNLMGALEICRQMGVEDAVFYEAIQSFKGAANRLELVSGDDNALVYKDFAHAPSKVKATVEAMAQHNPERKLIACLELHTFSSLSKAFLPQYQSVMDAATVAVVYFSQHALQLKKLPDLSVADVREAFQRDDLIVVNDSKQLWQTLLDAKGTKSANLLLMSSGNFDGMNIAELAQQFITSK
jgi:UDP-N-acetylmuramate: L-alanyl-gamma-D-glutamyl-meso-diaminopimelate ligase